MSCAFDGNNALYGVGIRIGVYLSLASTIYAKYHLPDTLSGALVKNAIFLFALLAAILRNAVNGDLHAVEGYVMLQVIFGFVLCGAESGSGSLTIMATVVAPLTKANLELSKCQSSRTLIAEHTLGLLRVMCAAINLWFWFHGIHHSRTVNDCPSFKLFVFAQFDSDNNIRKLFQAMATMYLFQQLNRQIFLIHDTIDTFEASYPHRPTQTKTEDAGHTVLENSEMLKPGFGDRLRSILDCLTTTTDQTPDFKRQEKMWAEHFSPTADYLRSARKKDIETGLRYFHHMLFTRDSVMLAWTVLTVELSLRWNHIGQVNSIFSTGQLIPLIIGIVSIGPPLMELIRKSLKKEKMMRKNKKKQGRRRRRRKNKKRTANAGSTRTEFESTPLEPPFRRHSCPDVKALEERKRDPDIESGWMKRSFNETALTSLSSCARGATDTAALKGWTGREETDTEERRENEEGAGFSFQIGSTKLTSRLDFAFLDSSVWMLEARRVDLQDGTQRTGLTEGVHYPPELREVLSYFTRDDYDDDEEDDQHHHLGSTSEEITARKVLTKTRDRSWSLKDINKISPTNLMTERPPRNVACSPSNTSNSGSGESDNDTSTNNSPPSRWGKGRMWIFHLLAVMFSLINTLFFIIFLPFFGPRLVTYMQRNMKCMIWPPAERSHLRQDTHLIPLTSVIAAVCWYLPRHVVHFVLQPRPEDGNPNGLLSAILYDTLRSLPSYLTVLVFGQPLVFYIERKPRYRPKRKGKEEVLPKKAISTRIRDRFRRACMSQTWRRTRYVLWPVYIPLAFVGGCWKKAFVEFNDDLKKAQVGIYLRILAWTGYIVAWIALPVTLSLFGACHVVYHFSHARRQFASGFRTAPISRV